MSVKYLFQLISTVMIMSQVTDMDMDMDRINQIIIIKKEADQDQEALIGLKIMMILLRKTILRMT